MPDTNKDALFEQYGFSSEKSKAKAPDFGGFMSSKPVSLVEDPPADTVEEYIPPVDEEPVQETDPDFNYMAAMQSMFQTLVADPKDPSEYDDEPAEVVEPEEEDPEPELSSFLYAVNGDTPVKSQTDLLSPETHASTTSASSLLKNIKRKKKGLRLNPELVDQSNK